MSLYSFMAVKTVDQDDLDEDKGTELQTIFDDDKPEDTEPSAAISSSRASVKEKSIPIPLKNGSQANANSAESISSSPPIAIAGSPYMPSGGVQRVRNADLDTVIVGSPPGVHDDRRRAHTSKKY